ncbi:alkaline phosphatase family protein [Flavivirga aquimarina]|uniref:Alkaline phosphatase family protein n=1 Tax=Flavivirga aquimarina TaxID=2027862 RepID=A0ABT8WEG7_9FLAO|nr:alkaline phosphatase family protein [Flavivirga aquimarina]MDO5971424.1 alkaline phosphatase family protein [Flavivirga aquimarina]
MLFIRILFILVIILSSYNGEAQMDYAASWKMVNTEVSTTSDSIDVAILIRANQMQLRLIKQKITYKGTVEQDGSFELSYVYPSIDKVPDVRNAENPRDPRILELYTKEDNAIIFSGIFNPTGNSTLQNIVPQFDLESLTRKEEDITHNYELIPRPTIRIYDQFDKLADVSTSFSNPFPDIIIDPNSVQVNVSNNIASISLEAEIEDALANIVNGLADIDKILVEYIDPSKEDYLISREVNFSRTEGERTKWKPYAHKLNTSVSNINIPLIGNQTNLNLVCTNVLGNKSTASVIIEANTVTTDSITEMADSYNFKSFSIENADNVGFFNPIQVRLTKPDYIQTISGDNVAGQTITYNGSELEMVPDSDENRPNNFRLSTPLVGLANIPESLSGADNLVDVLVTNNNIEVNHDTAKKDLSWNYTAHSPANVYTYVLGLTYSHHIFDEELLEKYELVPNATFRVIDENNKDLGFNNITINQNLYGANQKLIGYALKIHIPYLSPLLGRTCYVEFQLRDKKTKWRAKRKLGPFKIGNLKTVIVGVDGFAYKSANVVVNDRRSKGFSVAFQTDENDGGIKEKVLSAIPTVTWCNWTGIYSGQPPGRHGINGNSYLGFNSVRKAMLTINANAVCIGFNNKAHRNSESLFDKLVQDYPINLRIRNKLRGYSLFPWYAKYTNNSVEVTSIRYPKSVWQEIKALDKYAVKSAHHLIHHNPVAADRLDFETYRTFNHNVSSRMQVNSKNPIDIAAMYFPGPDNVGHYLGDKRPAGFNPPYNHKDINNVTYRLGPQTPEVDSPLLAIEDHALQVTDYYLHKNVQDLSLKGLLYGTLFVLVADHGLHAYQNDSQNIFNIFSNDIFEVIEEKLYKAPIFNGSFAGRQVRIEKTVTNMGGSSKSFVSVKSFTDILELIEEDRKQPIIQLTGIEVKTNAGNWIRLSESNGSTTPNGPISVYDLYRFARTNKITYSPNGGMAHLYIRSRKKVIDNQLIKEAAKILYAASTGENGITFKNNKLVPKNNPVINRIDGGAFGKVPAIFIKATNRGDEEGRLRSQYRWVKSASLANDQLVLGSIDEFLQASGLSNKWPDFKERIKEMNDTRSNGRSGDIVVLTDGAMGYLTVNKGDEYNGWHGGATKSESFIPMFINIPGEVVDESFIKNGFQKAKAAWKRESPNSQYMRNWNLTEVLKYIYNEIPRN